MKKFLGKCMSTIIALATVFNAAACVSTTSSSGTSNSGENAIEYTGNETTIKVMNFGGGIGRKWLDNAARRFERANVNKVFEDGKQGVKIEVASSISTGSDAISESGYNIYFDQLSRGMRAAMQQGLLCDITDVVTGDLETKNGKTLSIEDKIQEDLRYEYKGADGKYYALPHYEFYDGATYDVELFDKYGLYLADSSSEGVKYTCSLLKKDFYFVKSETSKKSCGNDGEYGTQDDGLPTTLEEFVALCDYMKRRKQVTPFVVAGNHVDYSSYFVYGLWTALSGYEASRAKFAFEGTVETVTGFSTDNLFAGVNTIKKPITQTVEVTEETGYNAINDVNKYYAEAFMELAVKQGWIHENYANSTFLHSDAMRNLILNGIGDYDEVGMIFEGSYWLNEAEDNDIFYEYQRLNNDMTKERNLGWFYLPTSLDTPVTADEGRETTLASGVKTYAFLNNNMTTKRNQEGALAASKSFLKFLYTDEELKNFIKQTGATKIGVDVEIDDEVLNSLTVAQKSVMTARANNRVVQQLADNATLKDSGTTLAYGIDIGFKPYIDGVKYAHVIGAIDAGKTARACFEATSISASAWATTYYKGK